jgi:UDP-N-acetylmuramoyl-tripeptide--D-alanyl-D-alanine ligase
MYVLASIPRENNAKFTAHLYFSYYLCLMKIKIEALYDIFLKHPKVSTDTRKLPENCIFFALKGENFDGNRFASTALSQGAAYCVVDDPSVVVDGRFLLVDDVLGALQALAAYHRNQFLIPVIAIGGSNGKTTTKELVAAVLKRHYHCHHTLGNLNNHIGVPLTLLSMPSDTEVAVIEMGTNQPGDIAQLCGIARPTHGFITNIGKEHLEGFGSLQGVKDAEGELFDYLAEHQGCVFVNHTEKYLKSMAQRISKQVAYRQKTKGKPLPAGSIEVDLLTSMPYVHASFLADDSGENISVMTKLYGRHNFNNIMTAIALGIYFKVPAAKIKQALEDYTPTNNRSQIVKLGKNTTILLDAYNANPSSMKPALQSLAEMPANRKIAILGDMLELGKESQKEHEAILRFASKLELEQLVLVGEAFSATNYSKHKALHFVDTASAKAQWFLKQDLSDALLLIKGSRGIGLEKLLQD